jgi:predicted permease
LLILRVLSSAPGLPSQAGMFRDFAHAFRSLRRAPGLAVASVVILAVGTGAGTSLFSVVKAVLLDPLPYADPERLAWIAPVGDHGQQVRASLPDFDDWYRRNHSFSSMAAWADAPILAGGGENPEKTQGALVTEDFFDLLGVAPALGRVFSAEEHRKDSSIGVAVIGHGLWQRAYGGDPRILGRKITVVGLGATVIGVMPPGFSYPAGADIWISARRLGEGAVRHAPNFRVAGRLRRGVAVESAGAELQAIVSQLKQEYPSPLQPARIVVVPLAKHITGNVRMPLLMLFSAVGVLLLIVCMNVASLMLVRVAASWRELAVRTALGAAKWHLFRRILSESVLLAGAGGALGILLSLWSLEALRILIPESVPRGNLVRMDSGVLLFAVALTGLSTLLFAALPVVRAVRVDVSHALKGGGRGQSATRSSLRIQSALVVSEVALSVLLLAVSGLLICSLARLSSVDPGFRGDGVLAVNLSLPMSPAERGRVISRYREILGQVHVLPGVQAAGIIRDLPFDPLEREGTFLIEGRSMTPETARWQIISPGTFDALRVPILKGRGFTDADAAELPGAAIVSASLADRFWRGEDPLGHRIRLLTFEPRERWLTIVGVAGDVRQSGPARPAPAVVYVSWAQLQMPAYLSSGSIVVRSDGDLGALAPAVRSTIRRIHPEAAVSFRRLEELIASATARQRFEAEVLSAFTCLAFLLATVGLYGTMSYVVTSNRRAIGTRVALGAKPRDIARWIAARCLLLAAAGSVLGLMLCVGARKVLAAVVFGASPEEPAVLAGAVAVMFAAASVACWLPARHALRVDPAEILRTE